MKYSNGNTEHSDHHDPVPHERCTDHHVCMHHEGAEAPDRHQEHVEDEDPVYSLALSPVQSEYGEEDVQYTGDARNK